MDFDGIGRARFGLMTTFRFPLVAIVMVSAFLAVSCGGDLPASPSSPIAPVVSDRVQSQPAPTQSARQFEIDFLTGMIDHHQMAVMMAQMLQASTERPEMQRLAENIIDSQSEEIKMMRGWLAE